MILVHHITDTVVCKCTLEPQEIFYFSNEPYLHNASNEPYLCNLFFFFFLSKIYIYRQIKDNIKN